MAMAVLATHRSAFGIPRYYGRSRGSYSDNVFISGATATTAIVSGLGSGTWYFTVSTVDAAGNESAFGYEMSKST